MADQVETMRTAQEVLMKSMRRIAASVVDADASGKELSTPDAANNLAKLGAGIDALERAIERDEGKQPSVYERRGILGTSAGREV
jgi:hypothetical protein